MGVFRRSNIPIRACDTIRIIVLMVLAAFSGKPAVLSVLLQNGASANSRDASGSKPCHLGGGGGGNLVIQK